MLSQKEFLVGCLIGGAIGVVAVAISTQYSDEIAGLVSNHAKKNAQNKAKPHAKHSGAATKLRKPGRELATHASHHKAPKKKVASKSPQVAKASKRTA